MPRSGIDRGRMLVMAGTKLWDPLIAGQCAYEFMAHYRLLIGDIEGQGRYKRHDEFQDPVRVDCDEHEYKKPSLNSLG